MACKIVTKDRVHKKPSVQVAQQLLLRFKGVGLLMCF